MDSSVLAGFIGVCGALGGAFLGAWLNPKTQEWQEARRLKRVLKESTPLDKFIIFNAYKNVYFPLCKMFIHSNVQSEEIQHLIDHFDRSITGLELNIRRMQTERFLFVGECNEGCLLALNSKFSALINQDKAIKEMLISENKQFIREKIYPLYEEIIESEDVFNLLQQQHETTGKTILNYINIFMHNIGVFDIDTDLSYLNPASPKTYLNFPKREFHPEFK